MQRKNAMKKSFLKLVFASTISLFLSGCVFSSFGIGGNGEKTYEDSKFVYKFYNQGEYLVEAKNHDDSLKGEIKLPTKIKNSKVVGVSYEGFRNCSAITSITIPDNYRTFGSFAFEGCSSLESINLPELSVIEQGAFKDCSSLESIVIPDSVYDIYKSAFLNCTSLKNITFPKKLQRIFNKSFMGCTSLKDVNLPDSLHEIQEYAFKDCSSIETFKIPFGTGSIDPTAFVGCDSLASFNTDESVNFRYIDGALCHCDEYSVTLIAVPNGYVGDFVIDDSITSMAQECFDGCKKITSVKFPFNYDIYNPPYFVNCESLERFYLYNESTREYSRLTSITRYDSFYRFAPAASAAVNYKLFDDFYEIAPYAFQGCKFTSFTLPSSLGDIGDYAFLDCKELEEINLPKNIWTVGANSFDGCEKLTSINIDDRNEYLYSIDGVLFNKSDKSLLRYPEGKEGDYTLPNDTKIVLIRSFLGASLTSVTLNEGCLAISSEAFMGCKSLVTVNLPSTIKAIYTYVFDGCDVLKDIYYNGTKEQFGDVEFNHFSLRNSPLNTIHCLDGDIVVDMNVSFARTD